MPQAFNARAKTLVLSIRGGLSQYSSMMKSVVLKKWCLVWSTFANEERARIDDDRDFQTCFYDERSTCIYYVRDSTKSI